MLLPLTDKQKVVFQALIELYNELEYPPSARELADRCGLVGAGTMMQALRKKGWAEKIEGMHRRSTIPTEEAMAKYFGEQGRLDF